MWKPPKNKRALDIANWPERDRNAWQAVLAYRTDDLLSQPVVHRAAAWRPSSRELFVRCYGLWLAWLRDEGLLDAAANPGSRISRERLLAYLRAQRQHHVTARTLLNHVVGLRHMFEVLAPEHDTEWVLGVIGRLRSAVVSTKVHSDLPSIGELFEFGVRLMRTAEGLADLSTKQRALRFRNGLIIALLAARPMMRLENIGRVRIGENLIKDGGAVWLVFNSGEMKGGRGRQAPLPPLLAVAIGRYIEKHRPVLLLGRQEPDRTLFISMMGRPIYPHAMAKEIADLTQAEFGRRVNLHDFRRATGNSVANEDPEHVGIVRELLGHTDMRTSEHYYIFADESAAFRRFEKVIEEMGRKEEI